MPRRRLVGILVAATVTAATIAPASAAVWAKGADGLVDVCFTNAGLTGDALTQAALSAEAWNVTSGLKVTWENCDAGADKVPVAFGALPDDGELGLTQWHETQAGQFVDATVTFDQTDIGSWITYLTQRQLSTNPSADAWRTVTCHEFGHALGLEHTTLTDSCMQTNVTKPNTMPGANDIKTLNTFYGGDVTAAPSSSTTSSTVGNVSTSTTLIDTTTTTRPTTSTTVKPTTTTAEPTTATTEADEPTTTVPDETTTTTEPEATTTTTSPRVTTTTTEADEPTSTTVKSPTSTTVKSPTSTTVKKPTTGNNSGGGDKTKPTKPVLTDKTPSSCVQKWRQHLMHHHVKAKGFHRSSSGFNRGR